MLDMSSQAAQVSELPPWVSVTQAADYCGVDRTEMYTKLLRTLEIRRIGVRGVYATGRLIRIGRGSLHRLRGEPQMPSAELPRWVTIAQAARHYQVSRNLIRLLIAHEQLDAHRLGNGRHIRIDRESLEQLGRIRYRGNS
jgi:excisionase family DNA binding protein